MSHNNIGGLKMPQLIDRGSMSPPKDNSLPKLPRANQKRYSDHTEMNQAYEDRHQNGSNENTSKDRSRRNHQHASSHQRDKDPRSHSNVLPAHSLQGRGQQNGLPTYAEISAKANRKQVYKSSDRFAPAHNEAASPASVSLPYS